MSGIYIHIPFCKQACHYCDFHFSTSLKKKVPLLVALQKELVLRAEEFKDKEVTSLYFGGGTPSLLEGFELERLIDCVEENYLLAKDAEITLEANPDDLDRDKISTLASTRIDRLSIGIQSFLEEELRLMNRAHSAEQSHLSLELATEFFENLSIDLIYGIPDQTIQKWQQNLNWALKYNLPHISSYALTVEPRTALKSFIDKGLIQEIDEELVEEHFYLLIDTLEKNGYLHYEISNFGKPGYFARNNTAYWQGKSYIGIGPSAHSYDGYGRSWNVRNNSKYIAGLDKGILPLEREKLSKRDRYNEYVMTGLRTQWGVSLEKLKNDFGMAYHDYLLQQSTQYIKDAKLFLEGDILRVTKSGKFLVDGIASHLFMLNLEK
ncbi:MAG: radical SAM family heme chaperone HemW [Flavobacteriaceae bacterium]